MLPALAGTARAATTVTVSLTFDDTFGSQYTLAYQHALLQHGTHATFFVNSGVVGTNANKLSWAQLQDLAAGGNEIGGKTVDGTSLTGLDVPTATAEVCNDRQALIAHGLGNPNSFAYPFGSRNATVEGIVASCGYGGARTSGSLSPSGPRYSGPNPPSDDYYAIRAWAPGAQITLSQLQSIVTGAAANLGQGGWSPILIQRVCDQTLDPANYATCKTGAWIELADLNAFLDWVGNAGNAGGAPAGTTIQTMGAVLSASDATPPVTTITCNGTTCTSSTYQGGSATIALAATDAGSGVSSTHYTTDGTDPSLSSPTYTGAFTISAGTTTVKYRSWDRTGNAEATKSQTVVVAPAPDTTPPTTTITCNGVACLSTNYVGGVDVQLSATDNVGGTGVDKTYYTTDGTDPTTSSTVYTGPFLLAGNTTLKFFSTDIAGNAEAFQTAALSMTPYPVIVSLTFDDQYENQWTYLRPLLLSHGMNATFYVITSDTNAGFSGFMSYAQLATLQAEGNDIGGHGVNHLDLTDPSTTQQQKIDDVCGSRTDLTSHGITDPQSFAYPFGAFNANAESIVQSCGFVNSRTAGGISSSNTTPGPPWAESSPPADPLAIKAIDVDGNTDKKLSDLEAFVTGAAVHGGGWLPLVFHQVCNASQPDFQTCIGQFGVRDTVLDAFMTWLQNAGQMGGAPAGTSVKTMDQVVNNPDAIAPTTTITCNGSPCTNAFANATVTVSLSATDNPGGRGVDKTYYTTDGSTPTTSSPVYTAPFIVSSTTNVQFFSTDLAGNAESARSQLVQIDTAAPTTSITCNGGACSTNYAGTVTVALSADDGTGGSGVASTLYTVDGSDPVTSGVAYTAPFTVPASATVKFFSTDAAGNAEAVASQSLVIDTQAPTTSITCNGASCAGWLTTSPVTVALSATDGTGTGVATTYYTTDGSDPTTNGTVYSAPFTFPSTTTVKFASVDAVGNVESVQSQAVRIDTQAPTSSITCNGATCSGSYGGMVSVALSATDGTGSGVASTLYTTDGSDPTTNGTVYSAPFTVSSSATVKFASTDVAGNIESVQSQAIAIDTTAPVTSITCGSGSCSGWLTTSPVTVTLTASDTGGSGVAATYYTTDGTTPNTNSPVYAGPFTLSATTTVQFFSTDLDGNAETVRSQLVQIDAAAPTTSIACNGTTCASAYAAPVTVALTADDGAGGSGVATTTYTTDGSDPTTNGIAYTAPFTVSSTATVKFASTDVAGNVEAVGSRSLLIDTTAPATSITCNGGSCGGWLTTSPITVTLTATDGTGGSGVAATRYTTDGSDPTTNGIVYSAPFTISATTTVKFSSVDAVGNVEGVRTQTVQIDTEAPTTTATPTPAPNGAGWNNANVSVALSATDAGPSGVATITYSEAGAQTLSNTTYAGAFSITTEGTTTVSFFATDVAGNVEATKTLVVKLDKTAPTHVLALANQTGGGSSLKGTTVYYRGSVAGSFSIKDTVTDTRSGPASAAYAAFGGTSTGWTHATPDVQTSPSGGPYVSNGFSWAAATTSSPTEAVTGADAAGNTVPTTLTFTVDNTAPSGGSVTVPAYAKTTSVAVTFSAGTDLGSGVNTAAGQLQWANATYTELTDTCGALGAYTNVGPVGPTSPTTITGLVGGKCYSFRYVVADNVGNSVTYTSPGMVKVDLNAPTVTSVVSQQSNGSVGNGQLQVGDKLVVTFSNRLSSATVPTSGLTGTEARTGNGHVFLTIPGITNGALDTGSTAYLSGTGSKTATFHWTAALSSNNTVLTITVTTLSGTSTKASSGQLAFKPAPTITDPAGNAATGTFTTTTTFKLF